MCLNCQVTLQYHVIETACKFMAQLFVLSHYTDRFYDQKHFDSGDIIVLFSPKFKGGNLLCFVTMVISLVAISI